MMTVFVLLNFILVVLFCVGVASIVVWVAHKIKGHS